MSDHPSPGVGPALSALIEQLLVKLRWAVSHDAKPDQFTNNVADFVSEAAAELSALSGSVGGLNAAPPAFTENEIKDVLTSLYQDGHVDLVLADRIAALMQGLAAGLNQSSMLNAALLKDCQWSIDDVGGDSVYETSCGHNFYFDDSTYAGENNFKFCAYCGGNLIEVKTSEPLPASPVCAAEKKKEKG